MLELIMQDKLEESKFRATLVEWQTKHICGMFVSMAEDKKHAKAITKHVDSIKLPLMEEEADVFDNREFEEVVEEGASYDVNKLPSYEVLEMMFTQNLQAPKSSE